MLQTLPETTERIQQELLLQTTLGPALMNTKGFAAPEVNTPMPGRGRSVRARARCPSGSPSCGDSGSSSTADLQEGKALLEELA